MKQVDTNKLNQEIHALTCGQHNVPPMSRKLPAKHTHLNYQQYKRRLRCGGDMALNHTRLEEQCPTMTELLESPITKLITLATNGSGYSRRCTIAFDVSHEHLSCVGQICMWLKRIIGEAGTYLPLPLTFLQFLLIHSPLQPKIVNQLPETVVKYLP